MASSSSCSSSSSSSFSVFLQRNIQSWIAVLVPVPAASLFFGMVSGHSVVSISITSLALLISTAIMALKPIPNKTQNQGEIKISSSEIEKVAEEEEEQQKLYSHDPSSSSEDYSDIDSTAQCSDEDDDDDDDEESLFEISLLPYSGNFVGHEKESSKDLCLQQQQQHCLMEFLTDMNEEDNMIEIDLSMGSIKCSGF